MDGEVKGAAVPGSPLRLGGLARGSHRVLARAAGNREATMQAELTSDAPVMVRLLLGQTPEQAEAGLGLTPADRRRVRDQLGQLGYLGGPARDRFDPGFRLALTRFQQDAGLPGTGYLNPETRARLDRRAPAPAPRTRLPAPPPPEDRPVTLPGGTVLQFPERGVTERWLDPDAP